MKQFKAVLVTGARQVGKSTLLQQMTEGYRYISFDNPLALNDAKEEPGLFFLNNKPPIILDEIQYITDLFPYIKIKCDESNERGLFALTGSQQFHLMKNVSESLAGRVAILRLSGLSLREILGDSFNEPFIPTDDFIQKRKNKFKKCDDIWERIHRGNYPELVATDCDWQLFYESYISTYIDRDVNDLTKVQDKTKFAKFMSILAARTGQIINYSNIAEQVEAEQKTIKEWISILEASDLIYIMQPYSNSVLKRAIKTPKIYFRDTGLVCYLTKHQTPEMLMNGHMAGEIFETFVVSEILKSFTNAGYDHRMYISYYRGKDKIRRQKNGVKTTKEAEIDIVIETADTLYPVEIKLSANPKLEMTNAFDVLSKVPNKKLGQGTVICMYQEPIYLNKNNIAIPVEMI